MVRGILTEHVMQAVSGEVFGGAGGARIIDDSLRDLGATSAPTAEQQALREMLTSIRGFQQQQTVSGGEGAPGLAMTMPYEVHAEAVTAGRDAPYNGYAHSFAGMGIQFLRQYDQAGLRGQIPLYSVYTVDEISIPAVKDAALGQWETRFWSPDLDNPTSKRFVADYRKKYGKTPVFYGSQSYDGIMLIDSAVRAVKGNLADTKGMIAAMRKADFKSVRGPFEYNVNHHPIQNFYLLRAEKEPSGAIEMHIKKTIFEKYKDSYYKDCPMKW